MRLQRFFVVVFLGLACVALVAVPALASSFPDVPSSHPYSIAIGDLAGRGIIGGYTDGNFGPSDAVTRQQFAKMVVLTGAYTVSEADICPFGDVQKSGPDSFYPDNYVAVCAAKGITTGKTTTTFDPYSNITRYQVVTMVVRMADNLQPGLLAAPSTGWSGSATWANNATHGANAARAEYNGLLQGLDLANLNPYGNMSRGEVAQVLHNLLTILSPSTSTTALSTTTTAPSTTTTTMPPTTTTTAPASDSPLRIVSVHYDAAGNDNENLNDEYIVFEVLRTGSLGEYAVEDAASHRYEFGDIDRPAGATLTLHTGSGTDTEHDLYWGSQSAIWNNDGDTVMVLDSQGQVVASYSY